VLMGGVDPRRPALGPMIDALHAKGVRALKLHPPHSLAAPNGYADRSAPGLRGMYEAAERLGMPVTVHTGTSIVPAARNKYADPLLCDDVAVDFPALKLVLAHAGRPLWYETAFFLARRHENVFLELSGIPPKKLLEAMPRLEEIAPKCLWGSDWPGPGVVSPQRNVEQFLALPLSDATKKAVLWDNPARVFGVTSHG